MHNYKGDGAQRSVALITGGASGIGRAIGEELALRGYDVVLADRQIEMAKEAAEGIRDRGGLANAVLLDVRDYDQWISVRDEILERTGRIDHLYNNAGIGVGGEISAYDVEDWDEVFDVNLRGVAYGIQAIYPEMLARRSGHIVNTASMAGLIATSNQGSYATTKHAVVGLSKALRIEASTHNVRVSVLCPGAIRTPILYGGRYGRMKGELPEGFLDKFWESLHPMDVDEFARKVIPRVLRNEAIIIEPPWWKVFWYLDRLSPRLSLFIGTHMHKRLLAELEAMQKTN